jgi:hypothetical protein
LFNEYGIDIRGNIEEDRRILEGEIDRGEWSKPLKIKRAGEK